MGKGGVTFEGSEEGSERSRTIAVTVVRRHFLTHCDGLDHAEGDITPLTEKFAIVVAVMLSRNKKMSRE